MQPRLLALMLSVLLSPILASAQSDGQSPVAHRFVCTDNGLGKVLVVSAEGDITWEYPAPGCQDVWRLPSGNFLFTHVRGVQEVTPGKQVVWEYASPESTEIHNCQPLPNGRVMICENGTRRLMEIDRRGNICKELKVETANQDVHLQFRIARKLLNGHYLIAFVGEHKLCELDADGRLVREIPTPGDVFVGIRLPNGNTLIGCGDGHRVIEIDPQGGIVWQIDENELPGIPLRFVAGLQRLPNGNTVVCNWGGHGHIGQQPVVFEVTRDKQVVWQVTDYERLRCISNIQLLDVPGDVTRGQILR